jgi:hypothetical protein
VGKVFGIGNPSKNTPKKEKEEEKFRKFFFLRIW